MGCESPGRGNRLTQLSPPINVSSATFYIMFFPIYFPCWTRVPLHVSGCPESFRDTLELRNVSEWLWELEKILRNEGFLFHNFSYITNKRSRLDHLSKYYFLCHVCYDGLNHPYKGKGTLLFNQFCLPKIAKEDCDNRNLTQIHFDEIKRCFLIRQLL